MYSEVTVPIISGIEAVVQTGGNLSRGDMAGISGGGGKTDLGVCPGEEV